MDEKRPKVGVGVLVFKEEKVLLGRRKGSHGEGAFGGTGGHLEYLESISACAIRETREEAGIEISQPRFLCVTNFVSYAPKHYLDIGMIADWKHGDPIVLEPDKSESWDWYSLDELPEPIFAMCRLSFQSHKKARYTMTLRM